MNGESNCLLVFGAGSVTKFHELVTSVICFFDYSVISIMTSNEILCMILVWNIHCTVSRKKFFLAKMMREIHHEKFRIGKRLLIADFAIERFRDF